jgi:hypothetical protein
MSGAPIAKSGLGLCLAIALSLAPAHLLAQLNPDEAPSRLQGVVVMESTFEPIADAVVTLVGTAIETRTGPMGQFSIPDAPLGTAWVRVTAPGLPSVREQVEVTGERIIFLQFRMPEDVTALLDEIMVDVWDGSGGANADVETALDLVSQKIPSVQGRISGDVGNYKGADRLRGYSSLNMNGDPLIVIDDVVLTGEPPLELLRRIPATDVASIEVLRGPVAAFRYPFAANGVIVIRTRKN